MIETIWHGRGGQGAFTAARLLGAAYSIGQGGFALAFPSFGPERRGAPMRAFTKLSTSPIGDRSEVKRADYVVYLDDTLFSEGWDKELEPGGRAIVNSRQKFTDARIISIDADGISKEVLGRSIPNTALLGALCAVCPVVNREDAIVGIRECMPERLQQKNIAVIEAVMDSMSVSMLKGVEGR